MLTKLLLTFFLVQFVRTDIPGRLVTNNSASKRTFSSSSKDCDGVSVMPPSCDSCTTAKLCIGPITYTRFCDFVPDKPFCHNGECSATLVISDSCTPNSIIHGKEKNPFRVCTGSGFYPDPTVCSLYHYCEGRANSKSDVYECPDGYVFNPDTTLCKRKTSEADCMQINCNKYETFSPYGTSKRYFGFCPIYELIDRTQIRVGRCSEGTDFDGRKCVYKCVTAGRFPDREDPAVYHECWENGAGFETNSVVCQHGKMFDISMEACR